jgi:hypothetical protein
MKNMKKIIYFSLLAVLLGCGKQLDKLLDNPSLAQPSAADVDLYFNNAQLQFAKFFSSYDAVGNQDGVSDFGAQITRMETANTGGTYREVYFPESFDALWGYAYQDVFTNLNAMFPVAESQKKFVHIGAGKIMKAYILMTLVDYFGDVPYSEANMGAENTNPKADPGKQAYDSVISLLNSAISDLAKSPGSLPTNDLFYSGSRVKWTTLAKTLQLKAYIQTRLVDNSANTKIQQLLTENNLIDAVDGSEDFQFQFSTKDQAPDSRHPKFINNYGTGLGANDYIGTHFMWMLMQEKGIVDPRVRYYLYRQTTDIFADIPNAVTLNFTVQCLTRARPAHYTASMPYCMVDEGYFGRDHLNNEGIPPDREYRTTFGVYPSGGRFDNNDGAAIRPGDGAKGAGILPIWTASFTEFVKAEAALTLGISGSAKTFLEAGIRKSFAKVFAFPAKVGVTVPANRVPTQATQDNYINNVLSAYDAAASNDERLNIIMKEWYLASWGNGVEPFNFYRRTGKPDNLQYSLNPNPEPFIRSFFYPAVYANLNNTATQKQATNVKVFWDTNPDNLFKY